MACALNMRAHGVDGARPSKLQYPESAVRFLLPVAAAHRPCPRAPECRRPTPLPRFDIEITASLIGPDRNSKRGIGMARMIHEEAPIGTNLPERKLWVAPTLGHLQAGSAETGTQANPDGVLPAQPTTS
jgi:hypothetical protein